MKELEKERPQLQENNRDIINYDNAIHPSRHPLNAKSSLLNSAQARVLLEKGSMFAQWTFHKPLSVVGKIFAEISNELNETRSIISSASSDSSSRSTSPNRQSNPHGEQVNGSRQSRRSLNGEGMPVQGNRRSLSEIQAEVERASEEEFQASLANLKSMFPNIDPEICADVLENNEWVMPRAIDQLLEISGPIIDDLYEDEATNYDNIHDNIQSTEHTEENKEIYVQPYTL